MRTSLPTSVLMVVLLSAVTGCSRYYWSKAGATPEQFTRDNQECSQQAAATLPPGAAVEAVEQYYRACLNSRGYVRATQYDPPPPGSYRGIEDTGEFAAISRMAAGAPRQNFEQQLAQLDDMKARGRITPEEYDTMRKKLVEGANPAALAAPPAVAVATPPPPAPPTLDGRWYGRGGGTLDIRHSGGSELQWDWELSTDRGITRAAGTGTAAGEKIMLVGRQSTGQIMTTAASYTFELTRDGDVLRGVARGPSNLPNNVEFRRTRP